MHLDAEVKYNDSPYGLLAMTGREDPERSSKFLREQYAKKFDGATLNKDSCPFWSTTAQDDVIWMGGSPDWYIHTSILTRLAHVSRVLYVYCKLADMIITSHHLQQRAVLQLNLGGDVKTSLMQASKGLEQVRSNLHDLVRVHTSY